MSVTEKFLGVLLAVNMLSLVGMYAAMESAKSRAKDNADLAALYEEERDGWITTAEQRALDLQLATLRRAQAEESVRSLQERLGALDLQHEPARKAVRESRPEDDSPVAPVLRNALELLP